MNATGEFFDIAGVHYNPPLTQEGCEQHEYVFHTQRRYQESHYAL